MRQRDTQMALVQGNSAGILNNLWGLGPEQEQGGRTGPQATQAGGIDPLESILGFLKSLKIRAQAVKKRREEQSKKEG